MSLREVILQEGINWFRQPVDSSGKAANNCSQGMPRAQQMAVKVINDAISIDINSQIQEAVVVIKSQIDGKIKLAVESAFKNIIGVK